jgi:hypothetical protein
LVYFRMERIIKFYYSKIQFRVLLFFREKLKSVINLGKWEFF